MTPKRINYRKIALGHYHNRIYCVHCGFGIVEILEVAHLDGNRQHNDPDNLAFLCPTCHKMHDVDIISTETIREMRDRPRIVLWTKRMKDAGKKAAASRRISAEKQKWHMAGIKASKTRKENIMRNLERLTPSEIESLRQDKRDALKKLREKSRRMAKEDSLLKVVEKAHAPITKG
jgi:L-lactate utilization protein LutB